MTRTGTEAGAAPIGAVAGVVAIVVVVGGVFLGLRSGEDPGASSSPSDQTTSEATDSTVPVDGSPSESESTADAREAWIAVAIVAAKDGFPAFVPAEVPAGWTAGQAEYVPDTSWHLDLTAPSGAIVSIDQKSSGETDSVVALLLGSAEKSGTVNLRRWGTGTWQAYTSDDSVALAQDLAGTIVVVSGATEKAEVVEITKQLLTAEMVVNVGDGSDG